MRYKRQFVVMLSFLLVLMLIPVSASASQATIMEDYLNVRSGPGTNYDVLGQVNSEETYPIIDQQDNWVELQLDGYTGWVITDYISVSGDESEEEVDKIANTEDTSSSTITIPEDRTQIRKGPSTDEEIIYFAKKGQVFDYIGESNGWIQLKSNDIEGYVWKKLVEENQDKMFAGIEGKTIVLDPGHGGDDSGAIGANDSLEKDVTFKTAKELEQELTMLGANVIMTRDEETFVSLSSRATLSNDMDTDIFISLHYNSMPEIPNVTGIGTYYYADHYENLARNIQNELIKATGDRDRGAGFGDFQVIRQNLRPSVLIELGFLSNPEIEELLSTNAYQQKLVSGIVRGVQRYFSEE